MRTSGGLICARGGIRTAVGGREHEQERSGGAEVVPALVEAQVETARAEVFRAYLQAREKARLLAGAEPGLEPADEHGLPPS
jgi:hypothetical protein